MTISLSTIKVERDNHVIFAKIAAPPMNMIGPELIADFVTLVQYAEASDVRVVVFSSEDPDFFIPHVDLTKVKEYRHEASKLVGEASIGLLFRRISQAKFVSIAQIEGRVRGAGSEFVLACDMRFAARETAVFAQIEAMFGLIPGAGAVQHLARLMGRGRALEVMLSAEDFNADLAEKYGWINRALPKSELPDFVSTLARRIAVFPMEGLQDIRESCNAIALGGEDAFRRDSELFGSGVMRPGTQQRVKAAMEAGLQTRGGEITMDRIFSELGKL